MLASNIHRYVKSLRIDPAIVWETLELQFESLDEVKDEKHLRYILAEAIVTYLDMAQDDEDSGSVRESNFWFVFAQPLLMSNLPLTLDEQRTILGAAAWWPNSNIIQEVRDLVKRPVLPPKDAV